jgi:hypothetical protein
MLLTTHQDMVQRASAAATCASTTPAGGCRPQATEQLMPHANGGLLLKAAPHSSRSLGVIITAPASPQISTRASGAGQQQAMAAPRTEDAPAGQLSPAPGAGGCAAGGVSGCASSPQPGSSVAAAGRRRLGGRSGVWASSDRERCLPPTGFL